MNIGGFLTVLVLSLPVSAISLTITKASVFENLRKWVLDRSRWVGKLVSCPYCTSHWVSFLVVAIYKPTIVQSGFWLIDLGISAFAIVAIATPISWVVFNSFRGMNPESEEIESLRSALGMAREKLIEQARQLKAVS